MRLATPLEVNTKTLELFITSKVPWIRRQQRKLANQRRQRDRKYIDGETHYLLGRGYKLRVIEFDNRRTPYRIERKGVRYIDMYVYADTTADAKANLMKSWYRALFKDMLEDMVVKWEERIGVAANHYEIKSMKTKWGSCKVDTKRITLNLELVKKPQVCIEYVLLHELAHLIEKTHNEMFLHSIELYISQWKSIRKELNNAIVKMLLL